MNCRQELYSGTIRIFKQVPSALKMSEYFTSTYTISGINYNWQDENIRVEKCKTFEDDIQMKIYWKNIITDVGIHGESLDHVSWDRIRLRIQPSSDSMDDITKSLHSTGRFSSSLPIHRDTWAGNVMQQLNWWTPLLPITEDKTLALYPSFFNTYVPNSSGEWSLETLREKRLKNEPYPQLPVLLHKLMSTEDLERLHADRMCIVISPGDVLVFSGAHLHGSVLNKTTCHISDMPRFSTEVRTIDMRDLASDIGAVNIDGVPSTRHLEWFRPLEISSNKM